MDKFINAVTAALETNEVTTIAVDGRENLLSLLKSDWGKKLTVVPATNETKGTWFTTSEGVVHDLMRWDGVTVIREDKKRLCIDGERTTGAIEDYADVNSDAMLSIIPTDMLGVFLTATTRSVSMSTRGIDSWILSVTVNGMPMMSVDVTIETVKVVDKKRLHM